MPNSSKAARSFLYRVLVLLLLLATSAGVAYNYYQASIERAQCRREVHSLRNEVQQLRKAINK